ncbi:MAG: PAS domain S-box protein [Bacteroidetes bacterium]|nr:PAS domain S-box protein [Bacteroidota bacterium]MBU1116775.1 PAS domain S-box protein [Bacteroidota bacterium]MBU1798836.1 PAS domain S-box protein [Bacteroidota bacterium]
MSNKSLTSELKRVKRYFTTITTLWIIIVFAFFLWSYYINLQQIKEIAKSTAQAYFDKDNEFGDWLNKYNGVYVSLKENVSSNLCIEHSSKSDIVTEVGDTLRFINHICMIEQFQNKYKESHNITGKIIELNSNRIENVPDEWEQSAMLKFENGAERVCEFTEIDGEEFFRIIEPIKIDEPSLKHYKNKNFNKGDIRGSISVSLPMKEFWINSLNERLRLISLFISLIIFGFWGIKTVENRFKNRIKKDAEINRKLREKGERLKLALGATNAGIWDWNIQTKDAVFDERWAAITGHTLAELEPINIDTWNNLVHPEDSIALERELEKLYLNEIDSYIFEIRMKHKNGFWVWVQIRGNIIEWTASQLPVRMVGIIIDISDHKKAEQNLIENEYKYRILAEQNGQIVYAYDIISGIISWSGDLTNTLGYTIHEFQNIDLSEWENMIKPEYKQRTLNALALALESKNDFFLEYEFRKKDCTYIFIEDHGTVIRDLNSNAVKIFGVMRDITERTMALKKLEISESNYRLLAENSTDSIWRVNLNFDFEYVSPEIFRLTGYTVDEIMNLNVKKLYSDENFAKVVEIVSEEISLGTKHIGRTFESILKHKDGKHVPVEISGKLIFDNSNNPIAISGYLKDISERKEAEQALRESESRFRTTFDQAFDPIFIAEITEGQIPLIIDINEAVTATLGHTREECIGKPMNLFHLEEKQDEIFRRVKKILSGEPLNFESIHYKKDGSYIPVEISAKRIRTNDKYFIYIIQRDISDRKKWEHDILQIQKALKDENLSKDKFFSIISHDLKSPFGTLLSITQMLDENFSDMTESEKKELISTARNSTKNIYQLLEALLEWSQASTGRMIFSPSYIKLEEITNKVILVFLQNISTKNIKMTTRISNNLIIYADEKMLRTVMRNLLANAIKFTQRGGQIKISSEIKDENIVISVSDNGIGMTQADINKLFRIDVHHTTVGTENESGTGVGLILCKELIEKNGGTIWAESELGKGSNFKFTIPLVPLSV